jgi:glycosyltransferase involved in cell wall biosynthesis
MARSYLLLAPIPEEESFGNVVLEAKSVGLPVVAFGSGGIPELVEHGETGFLCRSWDRSGLLEGIEYFLGTPGAWERARDRSLRSLSEPGIPYSADAFARAWRALFSMNGGRC